MTRKNHLPTLRRQSVRGTVYQCASFRLGDTTRQRTYGRWGDAEGRALFE
ncbi:MAG: hypothetical protein ACE37K_00760 [Planctomycetota bacterium]